MIDRKQISSILCCMLPSKFHSEKKTIPPSLSHRTFPVHVTTERNESHAHVRFHSYSLDAY
jgi:hypothetical protein